MFHVKKLAVCAAVVVSSRLIGMIGPDSIAFAEECDELGVAAYSAVQDGDTVTLFANGVHRTGGFKYCLVVGPEDVFPPIYEFKIKRPTGIAIQVITPFTTHTTFQAQEALNQITVRDASGDHDVSVVQISQERKASVSSGAARKSSLCKEVGSGAVGEPGASSLLYHQVTGDREIIMVLRTGDTSLCGNMAAVALLTVNGKPAAHGNISEQKSLVQTGAKPGDHVVAVVHMIPLFNGIVCARLGELEFTLEQCELE